MTGERVRALTLRVVGFPDLSLDSQEFASLQGATGLQDPPRTIRWWDGAGDGSVYRSTRINRRVLGLPVLIQGANADELEDRLNQLSSRFDPDAGEGRLLLDEGVDRGQWYLDFIYTGGLGLEYGKSTNGASWAQPTLGLECGQPYWTRLDAVTVPIEAAGAGRGLLKGAVSITSLRQKSGQTLGDVQLVNPGNAKSYPVTTLYGPATGGTFSSGGLTFTWSGVLIAGETRIFDHKAGTLVDAAGVNRYDELGPAPKFWPVPRGTTQASVQLTGDTPGVSKVTIAFQPRKWLVV